MFSLRSVVWSEIDTAPPSAVSTVDLNQQDALVRIGQQQVMPGDTAPGCNIFDRAPLHCGPFDHLSRHPTQLRAEFEQNFSATPLSGVSFVVERGA
jgi:hypothetical protein